MKLKNLILLGGVIAALSACETTPDRRTVAKNEIEASGQSPMTAEQIKTALVGNTEYSKGVDEGTPWEWTGYHREDGTMSGRSWWEGGKESDTGTWEVTEDNLYCRKWDKHWGKAQRGCYKMYRLAENRLGAEAVSGSAKAGTSELIMGNPYSY